MIGDRNAQSGEETVLTIRDTGGMASFRRADVSGASDIEALVDHAMTTLGGSMWRSTTPASRPRRLLVADVTEEEWDRVQGDQHQRRLALDEVRDPADGGP